MVDGWEQRYQRVPEGQHRSRSTDTPGADRDLLFDSDGRMKGPPESISPEEYERRYGHTEQPERNAGLSESATTDTEVWDARIEGLPESAAVASAEANAGGALAVVAGLALVGLAVGAVAAVASASRNSRQSRRELEWRIAEARRDNAQVSITSQRVAAPAGWYDDGAGQLRWWDGQDWTQHYYTASPREGAPAGWYDDGSGRQRWWDGQDWTQHYQDSLAGSGRTSGRTLALSSASSNDVERDYDFPAISLSRAQWEDQVRVMMQARMISELQWRVLSNARIEGADPELLAWQGRLRTLTAQEFSRSIDSYVASHPEQTLELATAGWYDDGSGRQRWWDGLEWTGYFQTDESRMLPVR